MPNKLSFKINDKGFAIDDREPFIVFSDNFFSASLKKRGKDVMRREYLFGEI